MTTCMSHPIRRNKKQRWSRYKSKTSEMLIEILPTWSQGSQWVQQPPQWDLHGWLIATSTEESVPLCHSNHGVWCLVWVTEALRETTFLNVAWLSSSSCSPCHSVAFHQSSWVLKHQECQWICKPHNGSKTCRKAYLSDHPTHVPYI